MKVAILHRTVCHYQVDSLIKLYGRLADNKIDLKIFSGMLEAKGLKLPVKVFKTLRYLFIPVRVGGLDDKLVLLPGLFFALIEYRPDLIVTEDISFMPNSLVVWIYGKVFKVPYLIRSLGVIPGKKSSRIRFFLEPLIGLFRNGAKAFLGYSNHAVNYYSSRYHKPCYVLCNSTMPPHTVVDLEEIGSSIIDKYSIPELRIAFIGRLLPQKRINLLLTAAFKLNCPVDIIGDGPARPEIEKLISELGIADKVTLHGQITEENRKKEILRRATLGVLPGLGGLAIQEMMWHGLPVISSHADGTEQDLILDGKSGFFVGEMNEITLSAAIRKFADLSRENKIGMAMEALRVIDAGYNVDSMVSVFIKGIKENIWVKNLKKSF